MAGTLCHGSKHHASWENLFFHSHHCFRPHNPPNLHPHNQQFLLWRCTSHKTYNVCIIIHFNDFLTAIGRDRDIQLHLETTNFIGGTTKTKDPCDFSSVDDGPYFNYVWWSVVLVFSPIFVNLAKDVRDLSFIFKETTLSNWFYKIFLMSDSLIELIYALLYIIFFSVLTFWLIILTFWVEILIFT